MLNKTLFFFILFSLCQISFATTTRDVRAGQDHPLIGRYPGFMIKAYEKLEYIEAAVLTGKYDATKKSAPFKELEAKVTNILYDHSSFDPSVSGLQLYKNYEKALKKLNANIILY